VSIALVVILFFWFVVPFLAHPDRRGRG
jgi:hypothetical protein